MVETLFIILTFVVAKLWYDNLMLRLENDNLKKRFKNKIKY